MAILIDADVVLEAERGVFDLFGWLASHPEDEFKTAAITVAEPWHGVERATDAHRTKRQRFVERVFAAFEIVPYSDQAAMERGCYETR